MKEMRAPRGDALEERDAFVAAWQPERASSADAPRGYLPPPAPPEPVAEELELALEELELEELASPPAPPVPVAEEVAVDELVVELVEPVPPPDPPEPLEI